MGKWQGGGFIISLFGKAGILALSTTLQLLQIPAFRMY